MPFDGTANNRAAQAVRMIDALIDVFAGGRHWYQGAYNGPDGSPCLMQAMIDLSGRCNDPIQRGSAQTLIRRAIRESTRFRDLVEFNDRCGGYDDMHHVLLRAREMATVEASRFCGRDGAQRDTAQPQGRHRSGQAANAL